MNNTLPPHEKRRRDGRKTITVEVHDEVYRLLEVLTHGAYAPASVEQVVAELIDHAQQGVYRPGAWERGWLLQAFGEDWLEHLEPGDPWSGEESNIFQRPKPRGKRR